MYDSTELSDSEITVAHTNFMETLTFLGKNHLVDKRSEQRSEGSAISRVCSSEVKQCSERSRRFHFNSSESKTAK